ncbi:hypothetical protein HD553DRAFT_163788 [Filobasidium floriforme]|uniref:uncharacterized protein n=1 Tax=Filobasidium floriforme TaxID=5210 RepID=UPI001E8DDD4C|nr:uncharacterized protein HD553DRAFT_163788 [Filobasidium floriforme]KAH8089324.1 hypothetical protein HD553DRAFT_163788 [Filobasidium floriforme]
MAAMDPSSNPLRINDNAQPSSSSSLSARSALPPPVYQANEDDSIISLHLPERLLVLPPAAFALGAFVGLSRGGSRARLRFLAENAHRPPTTVQGWYFYTKTRNYRILFGACRQGAKDALKLGAATALYVLAEEGVRKMRLGIRNMVNVERAAAAARDSGKGKARESVVEAVLDHEMRLAKASKADELVWLDGAAAGSLLASVVGLLNQFPLALFVRTLAFGAILGTVEGGLRIAQEEIRSLKEERTEHPEEPVKDGAGVVE